MKDNLNIHFYWHSFFTTTSFEGFTILFDILFVGCKGAVEGWAMAMAFDIGEYSVTVEATIFEFDGGECGGDVVFCVL